MYSWVIKKICFILILVKKNQYFFKRHQLFFIAGHYNLILSYDNAICCYFFKLPNFFFNNYKI